MGNAMTNSFRMYDFVKSAKRHGFDMWYDPSIKMWVLAGAPNQPNEYFTRAMLHTIGLSKFCETYLGVKDERF